MRNAWRSSISQVYHIMWLVWAQLDVNSLRSYGLLSGTLNNLQFIFTLRRRDFLWAHRKRWPQLH
jgi:hypothetical protein